MHLVIINASPRVEEKSNTARIIRTFLRGFEKDGNTSEVWHLSDKKQWAEAKASYEENSNILFAIPLYTEKWIRWRKPVIGGNPEKAESSFA